MAAIGQVAPVSKHSDEFARVEHALQLAFRSTGVGGIAAWGVANPAVGVAFERRARGMLAVDCLVDISSLDESNSVADVCKRGFHMPPGGTGLAFTTGSVRTGAHLPAARQFLLCTVAVGRSYVVDDPGAKRDVPAGFDSLYLHAASDADAHAGGSGDGSDADAYRHTYVVFDSAQVLPKYVIHCTYDAAEAMRQAPVRNINLAEIKARVADALAILGPSAPAATEKMLSDLGDAYESAIASSNAADPLLEERKRSIGDSLRLIDERLRAVQSNSSAVEEALYQKLQDALAQLQDATAKKMNLLLSEELELRRQLAQIEWAESFVHVMQDTLPPMSFITAWERHAALRAQLSSQLAGGGVGTVVRVLDEVQPDLKLAGDIQVLSERAAVAAAAATASSALGSTAAGMRFFGGASQPTMDTYALASAHSGAASHYGLASSAVMSTPSGQLQPGNPDVSGLWTQLLRQNMGLPAASGGGSANDSGASTYEQSQAQFALAKASLAAVEVAAAHAPASMRAAGELARLEAQSKVAEAQATMTALNAEAHQTHAAPRPPAAARRPSAALPPPSSTSSAMVPVRSTTPPRERGSAAADAHASAVSPGGAMASPSTTSVSRPIPLGERIARFSLTKEAERRRRQLAAAGIPAASVDASLAFPESRIVTSEQAMDLYLTLPFGFAEDPATGGLGNVPPATHLLFATYNDSPPTVQHFAMLWQMARANTPTLVLIRASTGAVFGGYAADPWDFADVYGGTPCSFLFSITRDCKLPYHGRVKGPRQPSDDLLRQQHEMAEEQSAAQFQQLVAEARMSGTEQYDASGRLLVPQYDENGTVMGVVPVTAPRPRPFVRHDCLKSNADSLQFGVRDLVITGDMTACTSEVENSYGIGLRPGSTEAQAFLAGAHVFGIEDMEIWEVTANPAESVTAALAGEGGDTASAMGGPNGAAEGAQ